MGSVSGVELNVFYPLARKPRRSNWATAGFIAAIFSAFPTASGPSDLGALLARQPGVAARARAHLIASPFGTIHASMFSLPRPVGTTIPHPPVYALANFDPHDVTTSIGSQLLGDPLAALQFPTVNRKNKRDSLVSRGRDPLPPMPQLMLMTVLPEGQPDAPGKSDKSTARLAPDTDSELSGASAGQDASSVAPSETAPPPEDGRVSESAQADDASAQPREANGSTLSEAVPPPGTPMPSTESETTAQSGDPDIKLAALAPIDEEVGKSAETIANKGVVTGVNQRPKSPAERLGLGGKTREKAVKCLASAVYFESRGESVRGQVAVAQVVMNRVFSSFYPNDVCGVVYQKSNRRYACQFTFTCDGSPDLVSESDAWARSVSIANDMLDGKLWMPEVARATHYHAFWVHPDWVNEMTKIYKLGVHVFYRPRAWGDGSDEPAYGDARLTDREIEESEQKWPVSHSLDWLRSDEGKEWLRSDEGKAYLRRSARN